MTPSLASNCTLFKSEDEPEIDETDELVENDDILVEIYLDGYNIEASLRSEDEFRNGCLS